MLLRHLLAALLVTLTPTPSLALSATGDRVLVVLEPNISKVDYSKFWASLEARGFELTFKGPKDDSAQLVKFGEAQYDHLIMFAPSVKAFTPSLSPQSILSAQLENLNTIYLLSSQISELQRDTFREYDLEFIERDHLLFDSFSHPPSSPPSSVLLPPFSTISQGTPIISQTTLSGGPILYPSGTVHTLGQNPYLIDILHAGKTAFVGEINESGDEEEGEVEEVLGKKVGKEAVISGKRAGLVSALQSRENVRIGFVGSGEMFSDKYWDVEVETQNGKVRTGNAGFVTDFSKWIFQETGVVKIVSSTHHRAGEIKPRELYRIKDDLTYTLTLSQHSSTSNNTSTWTPISLPDVQLDFTMLDPHIRTSLKELSSDEVSTTYSASFMAPDRHGVFKFVVEHWRPGWSYIRTSSTASVVPFRHDEYPRFIKGAWPFYTGAISMSVTFLLFCALWVMLPEQSAKGKKKAE